MSAVEVAVYASTVIIVSLGVAVGIAYVALGCTRLVHRVCRGRSPDH